MPVIPAMARSLKQEDHSLGKRKKKKKITRAKRARGVAEVVECLPCKTKPSIQNPVSEKKKKVQEVSFHPKSYIPMPNENKGPYKNLYIMFIVEDL
jgi:hypothetical protein